MPNDFCDPRLLEVTCTFNFVFLTKNFITNKKGALPCLINACGKQLASSDQAMLRLTSLVINVYPNKLCRVFQPKKGKIINE